MKVLCVPPKRMGFVAGYEQSVLSEAPALCPGFAALHMTGRTAAWAGRVVTPSGGETLRAQGLLA